MTEIVLDLKIGISHGRFFNQCRFCLLYFHDTKEENNRLQKQVSSVNYGFEQVKYLVMSCELKVVSCTIC